MEGTRPDNGAVPALVWKARHIFYLVHVQGLKVIDIETSTGLFSELFYDKF
jgi:hypothetical protein